MRSGSVGTARLVRERASVEKKRTDARAAFFNARKPRLSHAASHSPSSSRSSSFLNSLPRSGAWESWALAAMVVFFCCVRTSAERCGFWLAA